MQSELTIGAIDREQLPGVFREAFSDYAVAVGHVTDEQVELRCVKNNVDFDLSPGAYASGRLVGFTLVGVDRREGELCAYDAATGIVAAHRGKGLARRMFRTTLLELRRRGVRRFLLEVLQVNQRAIRAYRRVGFEIVRELRCFELPVGAVGEADAPMAISPIDRATVLSLGDAVDWQPSWECDFPAIRRIPERLLAFGAFHEDRAVGAIAFSPRLGWILTLVVRKPFRRRGVATALVRRLAAELPAGSVPAKLNNVDGRDVGMLAFCERVGFRHRIDQYEMSLSIG